MLLFVAAHTQALGLKPKSAPSTRTQPALEKHEVERLLKGGPEQEGGGGGGAEADADCMKGLGFNSGWVQRGRGACVVCKQLAAWPHNKAND